MDRACGDPSARREGVRRVLHWPPTMHCHLLVPDLFWPTAPDEGAYPHSGAVLRLPGIELLLARGRRRVDHAAPLERWVAEHYRLDGDALPLAPWRLAGEPDGAINAPPEPGLGARDHWLCVDPISLSAGSRYMTIRAADALDLDATEAASLIETLNRHFALDQLQLIAPHPQRWYTACEPLDLVTRALPLVGGIIDQSALPSGETGALWRTRITEAQMLLHEHPINQARELRGLPPINAIWPWGLGQTHALPPKAGETWFSDDPLLGGLARASKARWVNQVDAAVSPWTDASIQHEPHHNQEEWRHGENGRGDRQEHAIHDQHERAHSHGGRVHWYHLTQAAHAARRADRAAWNAALTDIEQRWVTPLVTALRAGHIGMRTLHAIGRSESLHAELVRNDLRRFWQRARPLSHYLAEPAPRAARPGRGQ